MRVSSSGACGLPLVQVVRHIRSLRPRAPKPHALGLGLCLSSLSQTPSVGLGTSASFRSVACALTSSARHHRRHYNHVLKADMEKKTSRNRTSVRSSRSRTSRHRRSAGIAWRQLASKSCVATAALRHSNRSSTQPASLTSHSLPHDSLPGGAASIQTKPFFTALCELPTVAVSDSALGASGAATS